MANEKQFHVGVKGIIQNSNGQVLLMKEDVRNHSLPTTEYWDFPGGRMQDNETILEALMREIEEETGIQEVLEPKFQAAVISNHQIKLANGTIVGLVLMLYKVKIASDAIITLSEEHLGYEWADRTVARERLQHKYPQEFTDKF